MTTVRFESVSEEARIVLHSQGISVEHGVHRPNRHSVENSVDGSYWEYDEVEFPDGTEIGDDGFSRDEVPEEYRNGPWVAPSKHWYRLPSGVTFSAGTFGCLKVWQEDIPTLQIDGDRKIWEKSSVFSKEWKIVGISPYATKA